MNQKDYFLKHLLVESLGDIETHFINKETGENEDNQTIKELLKNEKIKNRFYRALEIELQEVLKEVYGTNK